MWSVDTQDSLRQSLGVNGETQRTSGSAILPVLNAGLRKPNELDTRVDSSCWVVSDAGSTPAASTTIRSKQIIWTWWPRVVKIQSVLQKTVVDK